MSIFEALQGPDPSRYERRKLGAVDVASIRKRYAGHPRPTQVSLAREFGVSQPQISKIVSGKQWKAKRE